MPSLSRQLSSFFSSTIRSRGEGYFGKGMVKVEEDETDHFFASVKGSRSYEVVLSREKNLVSGECDCAYATSYDSPCKHLWAVILAADALEGRFSGEAEKYRLRFRMEDFDESFDDEGGWGEESERPGLGTVLAGRPSKLSSKAPLWKTQWRELNRYRDYSHGVPWPSGREVFYRIDPRTCVERDGLILESGYRDRLKNGEWGRWAPLRVQWGEIQRLPTIEDRRIFSLFQGSNRSEYENAGEYGAFRITREQVELLFPLVCGTGRCEMAIPEYPGSVGLEWDAGGPLEFRPRIVEGAPGTPYELTGELVQGERKLAMENLILADSEGAALFRGRIYALKDFGAFSLLVALKRKGKILIPRKETDGFFDQFFTLFDLPDMEWPETLQVGKVRAVPKPFLKLEPAPEGLKPAYASGSLFFDYQGTVMDMGERGTFFDRAQRKVVFRDKAKEREAELHLLDLGFRPDPYARMKNGLKLAEKRVPGVAEEILAQGWRFEMKGRALRQVESEEMEISTEVDWFDLKVSIDFGGVKAGLPELLKALRKSESTMVLSDGSLGVLSDAMRKKYGFLAQLGRDKEGGLSFSRAQAGLLDALLATEPKAAFDGGFSRVREELRKFEGIKPVDPTEGFRGQLRPYQKEGLGWLRFLGRLGLGGCLADDMGLGKTVQVLALLEARRAAGPAPKRPSLAVVPRSLIFNWMEEASRFTPKLRVLDHSAPGRTKEAQGLMAHDLVLTTYGVLRRDILLLKGIAFDYVILDESQAVKNAKSESSKAVRLLKGDHRLALSGTPVQNHLGELWSLFAFLNPGLLGTSSILEKGSVLRDPDPGTLSLLTRAVRPYLLRRTKEQVAADLPPKTEQTLHCELDQAQRKLYDELRNHYRTTLLGRVEREGMTKSRFSVLEALLRLRQAACHPGLLDSKKRSWPSAKLETLLPSLQEVMEEGHKALVFSQFTSFLDILKGLLDKEKVRYLYLDGKTKDRRSPVEEFQNDPDLKLFLISLKAGGVGLNLTAAEYIYLLDPWWNPAVEAQAVDRAHRIGQTKPVFAYRLIVKDTVEEKVLELQKKKKNLVGAILNADQGGLVDLSIEDLELLLS